MMCEIAHRSAGSPAVGQAWRKRRSSAGRTVLVAISLMLASCGGGDGGGSATPTQSPVQAANGLASLLNGIKGTEVSLSPVTGNIAVGVDYSYALLGFAFCSPADPFMAPLASPPAGQTVYGCANAVQASAALSGSTLTVTLTAPNLYIDFGGSVTVLGTTTTFDGALTATNASLTIVYGLVAQPDGNYKLGSVVSSNLSATWSVQTSPSLLATYLNVIAPLVESSVNTSIANLAASMANTYAATALEIKP